MQYRPEIDGMRAVAIAPVVLYHAGVPGFSGGFVGVDVFFVISGYLISRIIHEELLEDRFSILSFYERRARRILPALFTMLAASFLVGWIWLSPTDYDAMARSAGATAVFASNLWFWQNTGGYFQPATDLLPLLHTWSLAVEEQFYVLVPCLLLVLVRLGRRATIGAMLALTLASLALSAWATPLMPSASFYLLPTRFWELGLGSLLALGLVPTAARRWQREAGAMAGLAAILWAITKYDSATIFPGLAALLPAAGAAALIWAGGGEGALIGRVLAWRPIVLVGLLSYSLYLWHWPIMVFTRHRLVEVSLSPLAQAGAIILSVAAAWVSWRFVERPFRTGAAGGIGRRAVFAGSGISVAALSVSAVAVAMTGGVERRFRPAEVALMSSRHFNGKIRACRGVRAPDGLCRFGARDAGRRWLLWGDSHAEALLPAAAALAEATGASVDLASEPACPPLPNVIRSSRTPVERQRCLRFTNGLERHIVETHAYDTVLLHARWAVHVEGGGARWDKRAPGILAYAGATRFPDGPEGNPRIFAAALSGLVQRLTAAGVRVVVVGSVPELPWHVSNRMKAAILYGLPVPRPPTIDEVRWRQGRAEAILAQVVDDTGAIFVPLIPEICRATCPTHDGLVAFYRDENHLTPDGALRLAKPAMEKTLPKPVAIALTHR